MCNCRNTGRYHECCAPLPAWERELLRPVQNENDCNLTVIFTDGRSVTVPIMVPTSGEAVVIRDGLVLAEDRSMRCYTFPNVSYWYTDSI